MESIEFEAKNFKPPKVSWDFVGKQDVITCNAMLGSCAQRLEWRRALNAIVAKDNDGLGNGGTNVPRHSSSEWGCWGAVY